MKPPIGGPITGPTKAGMVTQVMAERSWFLGTERSSTSRPTGSIIAPPIPCTMRAKTRNPRLSARPHSTEPKVNSAMARLNTRRVPKRSAIQPLAGTNTATANR
jgi:hypothetical protein